MSERETRQQNCYYDDEIDLYELWLILKKRKRVVFGSVLFFLALSVIYILIAKPVYRLSHSFSDPISSSIPSQVENGISSLRLLLKNGEYQKLAAILGLKEAQVKKISDLNLFLDRKNRQVFTLQVDSYDKNLLKVYDRALVNFMKNLPAVRESYRLKREELLEKLKIYQNRLSDVLSLSEKIKEKLMKGKSQVIGFNPLSISTTVANYESQIVSIKNRLEALKPFRDVITTVIDRPVKPKKKLIVAVGLVSGLFAGVFLAFFLEWLEGVKRREEA